jgi:PKD repeat protein
MSGGIVRTNRSLLRRGIAVATSVALVIGVAAAQQDSAAAATPGQVVINELMYNPLSGLDTDEFLELANTTASPVDMSGWTFAGVTATLPAGATIPANGFYVLAPDAARFGTVYGGTPNAIYTGKLSNSGETVSVSDAGGTVIDSVTFSDTGGWPVTPDGLGPSLELIDPGQDHNDPLNWAASTAAKGYTVGAKNSVAHTGLAPRITDMTAAPNVPAANQPVTVTATITNFTSATLFYRVDFGSEVSKALTSNGNDQYSAVLPGVAAGHLLRYRIQATNAVGTTKAPRVDDTIQYQGVEAASGVSSSIPVLDWFIPDSDYNFFVNNPKSTETRPCVLAYNGVVYDNASVNIRGEISRTAPKLGWTFDLPHNHDLDMPGVLIEPVDTFAMEANWSDHSHGRQILAYNAYGEAGVVHNEAFPIRTQRNGAFQGLYLYLDKFDGTWRDREGYSNDQFFKAEHEAFDNTVKATTRYTKENPDDGDYTPVTSFVSGVNLTGTALRNYLLANVNIPEMINYAAATAIVQHVDSATHNFYLSQDPNTGRWSIIPWDLDHTWGNNCCNVNSPFVTPAEPGDQTSLLMRDLLSQPDWKQMYFRRLRTLVDQILAPGQLEAQYDAALGPAQPEAALDLAKWAPGNTSWTYAKQRTALFNALNARRAAFRNDSRVPAAQSTDPNIVINEIQHTPTGGGNAEFFELYNPSATEAVDLSGWSISDAVNLTIQPGTVILPHGFMVFAANDPTFRSTYGSTVFVGGVYSGGLAKSETITLMRPDGTVDDQVAYGGAGWPQATGGQSLELIDPSSDNNVGSNWALSAGQGSPGAPNGTAPVNNPPTAAFTSSCTNLACSFDGTGSSDSDGTISSYAWTFGDNQTGSGSKPSNTYSNGGTYTVTLTVTDNQGATKSVSHPVTVSSGGGGGSVSFVAAAHGPAGSVKTQQVTVPASVHAGDAMLLFFTQANTINWSGPAGVTGWTQLDTVDNGSTTSTVWEKTAASSDAGAAVRFTSGTYSKGILELGVYRGAASTAPVLAHSVDSSKSAHVTPTITAPAGATVVSLWSDKSGSTTSWTAPAGVTTRDTAFGSGGGRYTALLADSGGAVSGGSYGGLTATTNAASTHADMWTVALSPAG